MTELAIWHYRDWLAPGEVSMCGEPLRQPVGVVQTCEACLAELKQRREAGRAT